jgi:hypothetical protein
MKLTKTKLKQLIKEELDVVLLKEQSQAQAMLQRKVPAVLEELEEYINSGGKDAQMSVSTQGGGNGPTFSVTFTVRVP